MNTFRIAVLSAVFVFILQSASPLFADLKISQAKKDDNGFLVHTVESEFQKGPAQISVLLPDRLEKDRRYPVVYVLPVEAGAGSAFGNGLLEVKKLDLHNKRGLVFVLPTFSQLPWYADHPTNPAIRQESYFLKVVLPFVEKTYPALPEARGRLLLGFSKSGWGAFSLLLRHPDVFGKAAAWDAPMTMEKPMFGMGEIVGSQENFEKYRIARLLEQRADSLQKEKRLALIGYASFREHHEALHQKMMQLKIPHQYRDEKLAKHRWDAGWVGNAVQFLVDKE
jgi:S-formylglutathione hydrolase FrmB